MKYTLSSTLLAVFLSPSLVVEAQPPACAFELLGGSAAPPGLESAPGKSGEKRRPVTFNVRPGQSNRATEFKICDATSPVKDKTFKVVLSTPLGDVGGQPNESWVGESDDGSSLSFVVDARGHSTASYVNVPDNEITDIYTDADGNLQSVTMSGNDYPDEADPPEEKGKDKPDLTGRRLGLRGITTSTDQQQQSHRHLNDDGSKLDVLVLWTAGAECQTSGKAVGCTRTATTRNNMKNKINLAITETNLGYTESGVNTELNLVHADYEGTSYDDSVGFSQALSDIRGTSDGKMDHVHTLRTMYGADLVVLLIHNSQYCGMAYLGPSITSVFSVTAWNCATGYYSFGHGKYTYIFFAWKMNLPSIHYQILTHFMLFFSYS